MDIGAAGDDNGAFRQAVQRVGAVVSVTSTSPPRRFEPDSDCAGSARLGLGVVLEHLWALMIYPPIDLQKMSILNIASSRTNNTE